MSKPDTHTSPHTLGWLSALLLARARPLGHAGFWLVVLFFYTLYFGLRQDSYGQGFVFVGLLLPITIVTTYFILYWLIPRYLLKRRYVLFSLYFVYTLVFSLYLEMVLLLLLYINVADYQAMYLEPGLVELLDVIVGMYLVIFIAVAINLLKRWMTIQTRNSNLEKLRYETEFKLKDAELQLLKSQIHPHFLFNTLNNLYALSLEKSDLVPDVILKISQQLDYMLYRGDAKQVSVREELNHIKNYLDIEALRYDADRLRVSFKSEGALDNKVIAPLLLIPLVENSFKHGIRPSSSPGWIDIKLLIAGNQLVFEIVNSLKPATAAAGTSPSSDAPGIGLANVQRRLALLYPNAHTLDLREDNDRFAVKLKLTL